MDYKEYLLSELERGFSKSDLERIIGLPQNNLSGVLSGDRNLSKKSLLKIEKFMAAPKLDPLDYIVKRADKIKHKGIIERIKEHAPTISYNQKELEKELTSNLTKKVEPNQPPRLKGESSIEYRLRMIEENKK